MSPLWVSHRSMTSRFPPFAFVEMVSPYNKKNITRWLEDMNFMFSWQKQDLTRSLHSLVRYCSCHSNIKFISSRHRVISSIYPRRVILHKGFVDARLQRPKGSTFGRATGLIHLDQLHPISGLLPWKQRLSSGLTSLRARFKPEIVVDKYLFG